MPLISIRLNSIVIQFNPKYISEMKKVERKSSFHILKTIKAKMTMSVVSPLPRFTSFSFLLAVILAQSLLVSPVLSAEPSSNTLEIGTAEDLISFSNNVNSGTSYSGTTILLTDDIYFNSESSDRFCPIGNRSSLDNAFRGVFDGQGYTINNLKITNGSGLIGLFGFSFGGTIKNVILSPTCEVICQTNNTNYVSGIIGILAVAGKPSFIINSVNMASVSFNGTFTGKSLSIGGIVGQSQESVKNCANFGTITVSGAADEVQVGGISGNPVQKTVLKCINYGDIVYNGNSNTLCMGGILGSINSGTSIKNCVSIGEISVAGTVNGNSSVGAVVGNLYDYSTVIDCYWDDSINYPCYGSKGDNSKISNISSFNSNTLQLNKIVTAGEYTGKSLINALNAFTSTEANLSQWAENGNAPRGVSFFINNRQSSILATSKKVILLPNLADGTDNVFHGWFIDKCLNKSLNGMTIPDGTTILYGRYGDFTPQQQECEAFSSSSSSTTSSPSKSSSSISSSIPTPSEYVEIVFGKKNITREEAIEIIKEFVGNDDFEIVEFEDTDGGKRIIVKFKDIEKANEFVETAGYGREEGSKSYIKKIGFIDEKDVSLSSFKVPSLLMLLFSFVFF